MQILECLCETRKANIIHCDLKPENVLLESALGTSCKVIDFGSACFEERTVYSYIQSRFYRSPEVLLGASRYTSRVDMWSLGCLAAELFLGLPLYPGVSDYDMLRRITESVGAPAPPFLRNCKLAKHFFTLQPAAGARPAVRLMTTAEHQAATGKPAEVGRLYFRHLSALPPGADVTLTDVIMRYPLDSNASRADAAVERTRQYCFLKFLQARRPPLLHVPGRVSLPVWHVEQRGCGAGHTADGPVAAVDAVAGAAAPFHHRRALHGLIRAAGGAAGGAAAAAALVDAACGTVEPPAGARGRARRRRAARRGVPTGPLAVPARADQPVSGDARHQCGVRDVRQR